jgi:hypothetical protein
LSLYIACTRPRFFVRIARVRNYPIRSIEVPPSSEIARQLPGANFYDSYEGALQPADAAKSATELSLQTFLKTPGWVDVLMRLRNQVVALVGLKNLGALSALDQDKKPSDYRVGDRVGIFTLQYLSENEVILGDSDKHLDVSVSVCKLSRNGVASLAVSTVVHVHNRWGKFYMLFVGPAHKVIAPTTLRNGLRQSTSRVP